MCKNQNVKSRSKGRLKWFSRLHCPGFHLLVRQFLPSITDLKPCQPKYNARLKRLTLSILSKSSCTRSFVRVVADTFSCNSSFKRRFSSSTCKSHQGNFLTENEICRTLAIRSRSLAASEFSTGTVRAQTATLGSRWSRQVSLPTSPVSFLSFASVTILCKMSMFSCTLYFLNISSRSRCDEI